MGKTIENVISFGIIFISIVFVISYNIRSCSSEKEENQENIKVEVTENIHSAMEKAYFDGQRHALEGDIRIKKEKDGCWVWIKSPWQDERKPIINICND